MGCSTSITGEPRDGPNEQRRPSSVASQPCRLAPDLADLEVLDNFPLNRIAVLCQSSTVPVALVGLFECRGPTDEYFDLTVCGRGTSGER